MSKFLPESMSIHRKNNHQAITEPGEYKKFRYSIKQAGKNNTHGFAAHLRKSHTPLTFINS
jgi:hypothetical protein